MSRFNVSRDRSGDGWFRVGSVDVTSTLLLVGVAAVGLVVSALAPTLLELGAFEASRVFAGQVWRVVTWPFVSPISLWSALGLFLLWYFGTDLERQVGRVPMLGLYAGIWGTLTAVTLLLGLIAPGTVLVGVSFIQFVVLLLWIAEYPRRPFFFGIPAWVIGAVLVAVQLLSLTAARDLPGLASLLATFAVSAVMARRAGLLSDFAWIPGRRSVPRPSAPARPTRRQRRQTERKVSDAERLDELLEKISAQGIHALTPRERKEIEEIRKRRKAA